jgi:hypothetical protein
MQCGAGGGILPENPDTGVGGAWWVLCAGDPQLGLGTDSGFHAALIADPTPLASWLGDYGADAGIPGTRCMIWDWSVPGSDGCPEASEDTVLATLIRDGEGRYAFLSGAESGDAFDLDQICGAADNSPFTHNSTQADTDNDTVGDACDNCRAVANLDQVDADRDLTGDACDPDYDRAALVLTPESVYALPGTPVPCTIRLVNNTSAALEGSFTLWIIAPEGKRARVPTNRTCLGTNPTTLAVEGGGLLEIACNLDLPQYIQPGSYRVRGTLVSRHGRSLDDEIASRWSTRSREASSPTSPSSRLVGAGRILGEVIAGGGVGARAGAAADGAVVAAAAAPL